MAMSIDVSVILPTYNEALSLRDFVPRLAQTLESQKVVYEIVVVDDNSPDRTYEEVRNMSDTYPIRVIRRIGKLGLSSAILTGLYNAVGNVRIVMDADGQHPVEAVPELFAAIQSGADIAIGSRYVSSGSVSDDWENHRRWNSRIATWLARPLLPAVRDPMSGFFACRSDVFEGIRFYNIGYKFLLELLVRGNYNRASLLEIPIHFQKRIFGESKMRLSEVIKYCVLLGFLYIHAIKNAWK